jgi:hypothetical protein
MLTNEFAEVFAKDWIDSWNSHDLPRILSHYSDQFTMSSPFIAQIAGEESGQLVGKSKIKAYWASALEKMPTLRFEHVQTLVGAESVVIYYKGIRGMVSEAFFFGPDNLVFKAVAHYA